MKEVAQRTFEQNQPTESSNNHFETSFELSIVGDWLVQIKATTFAPIHTIALPKTIQFLSWKDKRWDNFTTKKVAQRPFKPNGPTEDADNHIKTSFEFSIMIGGLRKLKQPPVQITPCMVLPKQIQFLFWTTNILETTLTCRKLHKGHLNRSDSNEDANNDFQTILNCDWLVQIEATTLHFTP